MKILGANSALLTALLISRVSLLLSVVKVWNIWKLVEFNFMP